MNISIKTIPHNEQRYETAGDWWFRESVQDGEILEVRVSDMGNPLYTWLVASHEINEALRCKTDGVDEKDITVFDKAFEALRERFPSLIGDQEPGDMVSAPYHDQHVGATNIERLSAEFHGVDWDEYDTTVNSLSQDKDVPLDSMTGKPRVLPA